jgi:hypothetical protein
VELEHHELCPPLGELLLNDHQHVGGTGERKHEIERAPLTLDQRVPGSSPGAPTNEINGLYGRGIELYRRHAKAVCSVFDEAIRANASKMREGNLPADCLLSLVVSGGGESLAYAPTSAAPERPSSPDPEIRISIDETAKRVIFGEWGDIRGVGAALIMALAAPFRYARENELPPERYPFLKPSKLIDQLSIGSHEALRRRVFRCRNAINKLAKDAGDAIPSGDAVIESVQWHGYRLNPDRVRLVALPSEATAS